MLRAIRAGAIVRRPACFTWYRRNLSELGTTGRPPLQDIASVAEPYDVVVLYGSHTGTSREIAHTFARELRWRLKLNVLDTSLDTCTYESLGDLPASKLAIFMMSSYGKGGPTSSAQDFWDSIFGESSPVDLKNLNYSVFARGNSLYSTYNFAGILVDKRLQALGAVRFSKLGKSDKMSSDAEDEYFEWKEAVVTQLRERWQLEESPYKYIPSVTIQENCDYEQTFPTMESLSMLSSDGATPQLVPLCVDESQDKDGRSFLNISADLSETSLSYDTGDYLLVWPQNPTRDVNVFLRAVNLQNRADMPILVNSRWTTTYRQLVTHFVDINAQITRERLFLMGNFAPNDDTRKIAQWAASSEDLFTHLVKRDITLGRAMLDISNGISWNLPNTAILDLIPPLAPRYFSISSSRIVESSKATLGIVVEKDGEFEGLATNFLKRLAPEGPVKIPVTTASSTFKLPSDPSLPVIMIGIGTGIAPFRAFASERDKLAQSKKVGPTVLFAGCRDPSSFIYKEDFDASATKVFPAYSRSNNKCYVQDVIKANKNEVYDLIQQGAYVYICGAIRKLKRHARTAVTEVIAECENISFKKAESRYKQIKRAGRVIIDTW